MSQNYPVLDGCLDAALMVCVGVFLIGIGLGVLATWLVMR